MKAKMLSSIGAVLFGFCIVPCAAAEHTQGKTVCEPFAPSQVRLLPSRFQENMRRDSAWMMSVPVNSLLHSFRNNAGVFSGREGGYMVTKKLAGWESLDCDLRGHITGHLLSALAYLDAECGMWSDECGVTNDGRRRSAAALKADSIVQGLREVQLSLGSGYLSAFGEGLIDRNIEGKSVWAPFYTLHKILQGLLDQYTLSGNETALTVARGMGDWAYRKLQPLSEETRRRMLRNEFGGFNEAMYNLYAITHDERHLWVARFFYHNDKVDPLKRGDKNLGTNHANTFIPKLLGECRNYELGTSTDPDKGEESRRAAELLFLTLTEDHAFVTGEVSDKEHLFDPSEQSRHLTGYDGENCCTYNLLKLGQHLFSWSASPAVADYTERALYNHILGQQDPETGMVCYFTPLMSGGYRLYSTRDSSFWCCVGSGFESHVRYNTYIYYHSDDALWVNLFIPSELDWDGTRVTQETRFPENGRVRLRVTGKKRQFQLCLRRPWWATSVTVKKNGRTQRLSTSAPTLSLKVKTGDVVDLDYGMEWREEATKDSPSKVALLWGPVVMAGELEEVAHPFSDPKKYNDYYTFDYGKPQPAPLSTVDRRQLRPFYDVHHHRYVVYWDK